MSRDDGRGVDTVIDEKESNRALVSLALSNHALIFSASLTGEVERLDTERPSIALAAFTAEEEWRKDGEEPSRNNKHEGRKTVSSS